MTTDSIGENDMGEPGVVEPRTEAGRPEQAFWDQRDDDETLETITARWAARPGGQGTSVTKLRAILGLTGDEEREGLTASLIRLMRAGKIERVDGHEDRFRLAAIANLRSDGETRTEPTLTTDTVTERERTAYWRGFHKKAIDGSHIPGSEAER